MFFISTIFLSNKPTLMKTKPAYYSILWHKKVHKACHIDFSSSPKTSRIHIRRTTHAKSQTPPSEKKIRTLDRKK